MAAATLGRLLLEKQAKDICTDPADCFSAGLVNPDNSLEWEAIIFGPPGTMYEGGIFRAIINFSKDYPLSPPAVRFTTEVWHPNVYPDGSVCVSILHPPGDDPYGYELASERWSPVHTVETVLLSVVSLLSDPNCEAPANVDAAKEWKERRDEFRGRVMKLVRKSQDQLT